MWLNWFLENSGGWISPVPAQTPVGRLLRRRFLLWPGAYVLACFDVLAIDGSRAIVAGFVPVRYDFADGLGVLLVKRRRYGVVCTHSKPSIAISFDLFAQMPCSNIGSHAGIHQIAFTDAVGFELEKMHAVDLSYSVVQTTIAVTAYGISLPAAFLPQYGR